MVLPRSGCYKRHIVDKSTGSAKTCSGLQVSLSRINGVKQELNASYEAFCPAPLPPNPPLELSSRMVALLVKATGCIRELDVRVQLTPNVEPFIAMLALKEALMSSQIEGIAVTLEELLDPQREESTNPAVRAVVNNAAATEFALQELKHAPLSNRLLKDTHAVLMQGDPRTLGEFRTKQNWIGRRGSTPQNALYVPPAPDDMLRAMDDLERYIHGDVYDDGLDVLIRAALIHYQFETIHPFIDGNGRMGRLLITLFLHEQRVLSKPALYISCFLKEYRREYYSRLMEVRTDGHFDQWVQFFLQALIEAAENTIATIKVLVALRQQNQALIAQSGRAAARTQMVFDYLERHPIIEIGKTAKALDLSFNTVASAVQWLVDKGILVPTTNFQRNRVFAYDAYLKILRPGTELKR